MPVRRDLHRERAMAARAKAGETFRSIADDYGVSREWVRQLVKRHDVTGEVGRAVRRRRAVRDRTKACDDCGSSFVSTGGARYCSRDCGTMGRRGPQVETSRVGPDGLAMSRHPSGHWVMRSGVGHNVVRVERYMVQKALGRRLKRNEWVRLLDGNPDNLSPQNIAMMSPAEAHKMRGGKFAKANRKRTPTYTTLAAILRSGGVASRQPTG